MKNSEDLNKCRVSLKMQKNQKCNLPLFHEKSWKSVKKLKNYEKTAIFKDFS